MRIVALVSFLLAAATGVGAQSAIDGGWTFTLDSPMGAVSAKVDMKSDGAALTGTFEVNGATWPIEQGKVNGDTITFVLNRPRASMSYEMMGKVSGDSIAGHAAAMGTTVDWSMARAR